MAVFHEFQLDTEHFLKSGDVVRLFHAEEGKFLACDKSANGKSLSVFLRNSARLIKTSATSSKALWEVEVVRENPTYGGTGKWESFYRFKNLSTETYLSSVEDDDDTYDPTRERLKGWVGGIKSSGSDLYPDACLISLPLSVQM